MVKVYYTEVFSSLEENCYALYLSKIEEERRKKILLMKNERSRLQSLTAGSLLHFALSERTGQVRENTGPFAIGYEKNGKPYLKEFGDIHFNLSHSGLYVCCALGDAPVGIDIQKITDMKMGFVERFFTEKDIQKLDECKEKERRAFFFRMWSVKESFIKLTGRGIAGGLDTFEIDWERNRVLGRGEKGPMAHFMTKDDLTGYSACVCSFEPLGDDMWEKVMLSPFL